MARSGGRVVEPPDRAGSSELNVNASDCCFTGSGPRLTLTAQTRLSAEGPRRPALLLLGRRLPGLGPHLPSGNGNDRFHPSCSTSL